MAWKFSEAKSGKVGSEVKKDRDGVLAQLLKGGRDFKAYQLTY